jgi:hypothetical protein
MTDDAAKRKQKKELDDAEREIARLNEEHRKRQERRLNLEEELPTKSKILQRPLIEEIPDRKMKAKADESGRGTPLEGGADVPSSAGNVSSHAGGHPGGGHHGGGGAHGHDSSAGHGHSESSSGTSEGMGEHGGEGHGGDGHGDGHGGDGGGGGHGHITGVGRYSPQAPMQAATVWGLMKEAVLRRRDSGLVRKGSEEGVSISDLSKRMWGFTRYKEVMEERMKDDLRTIEETSRQRMDRIGGLNAQKSAGGLTYEEAQELKRLEDTEAMRYWLREKFLRAVPLEKQDEFDWVRPIGKGAFGVMPYTVITTWDLMTPDKRAGARWVADNYLLRWQTAHGGLYLPRTPNLKWFQEKAKQGIETLFEDWNEEIYSDKAWRAMVKKGQAELEKFEEELTGYDQYTVAEERQIAKMLSDYLKQQQALSKEPLYYA